MGPGNHIGKWQPKRGVAPSTDGDFDSGRPGSPRRHGILGRLRDDLQLAIITSFGAFSLLAIMPFGVYRLVNGEIPAAIANGCIVVALVLAVLHSWKTGNLARAGVFVCTVVTLACMFMVAGLGHSPYWVFAVLLANFLLAERRFAFVASLALAAAVVSRGHLFATPVDLFTFATVTFLVALYAFIFATRTERQHEQLVALASRDALTNAANRRVLRDDLIAAIRENKRTNARFGLAVLDLDHFKQVNDRFGHEAGDQVLIELTEIVESATRQTDRFYRMGGEEFVLLLPDVDMNGLRSALRKLQRRLRGELVGPGGAVTVSMGGALLAHGEDWSRWLARADAALFRAKREGRDRIEIDGFPLVDATRELFGARTG